MERENLSEEVAENWYRPSTEFVKSISFDKFAKVPKLQFVEIS